MEIVLKIILGLIFILLLSFSCFALETIIETIEVNKKSDIELIVIDKNTKGFLKFKNLTIEKALYLKPLFEKEGKTCFIRIQSKKGDKNAT